MDLLTWARSPWGEDILAHISWNLFWASLFAGVAFFVAHASYMVLSAHRKRPVHETEALEAFRQLNLHAIPIKRIQRNTKRRLKDLIDRVFEDKQISYLIKE